MVRMLVKLYKWEARGAICTLSPWRFFSFVSIISLHWKTIGLLVLKLTERIILVALSRHQLKGGGGGVHKITQVY